jgi:hypothetical protein
MTLSIVEGNGFFGLFSDIDRYFGGFTPFGAEDNHVENILNNNGGSMVLLPPPDSMTASLYLRKILDVLEVTENHGIPSSFSIFLPAYCFRDVSLSPKFEDLKQLEVRLLDSHQGFIRHIELLPANQHSYCYGEGSGVSHTSTVGSLFMLLQNTPGKMHYPVTQSSVVNVIMSMTAPYMPIGDMSSVRSSPSPIAMQTLVHGNLDSSLPSSPNSNMSEFGGDFNLPSISSLGNGTSRRRGRLVKLVDDGNDDGNDDVDMMSGMLNSFMFQNNSTQDVDIEAISLLGINNAFSEQPFPNRFSSDRNS